jgi:hypothetical protein
VTALTIDRATGIELYWLPLGAGGRSVRVNGRVYEGLLARIEKRHPLALYHSALVVNAPSGRFVIEVTPVASGDRAARGAVAEGPVGSRIARRLRIFRYEVRCWRNGTIPDVDEAVDSPRHLSADVTVAEHVLRLAPQVPTLVWGRDESGTGDMWNSNSVISWLIARSGLPVESVQPPTGGRAPGWTAGIIVARREQAEHLSDGATQTRLGATSSDESAVPKRFTGTP